MIDLSNASEITFAGKDVAKIEMINPNTSNWDVVWQKSTPPPIIPGQFKLVFQFPSEFYMPDKSANFEVIVYKKIGITLKEQGSLKYPTDTGIKISKEEKTITCMFLNMEGKTEIGEIQINYSTGSRKQSLSVTPISMIVMQGETPHFYWTEVSSEGAQAQSVPDIFKDFTISGTTKKIDNVDFDNSEITLYIDKSVKQSEDQ